VKKITVSEALYLGKCNKCCAFRPEIKPPFTTHCASTMARTIITNKDGRKEFLCTKMGQI